MSQLPPMPVQPLEYEESGVDGLKPAVLRVIAVTGFMVGIGRLVHGATYAWMYELIPGISAYGSSVNFAPGMRFAGLVTAVIALAFGALLLFAAGALLAGTKTSRQLFLICEMCYMTCAGVTLLITVGVRVVSQAPAAVASALSLAATQTQMFGYSLLVVVLLRRRR